MANGNIPSYLASASPNPATNRAPWYKNTAQSYAGIFLWIAFFDQLGGTVSGPGALAMANLAIAFSALICAGLACVVLFYLVPGLLGMKTGLPLYIVGTSTFGTKGGYFLPGIFMGLLQIGWYSVATYFAAMYVLKGLGLDDYAVSLFGEGKQFSMVFVLVALVWGYVFAFIGALGINYVARVATFFPIVIIVMLIVGVISASGGLANYDRKQAARYAFVAANMMEEQPDAAGATAVREKLDIPGVEPEQDAIISGMALAGFLFIVQMVVGFFATAGAVGADFCSNNRNEEDVWLGGLIGIGLATVFAGGLGLLTVAGAKGLLLSQLDQGGVTVGQLADYTYGGALPVVSPMLGKVMLLLFAVGSMAPACFCSFIIGNSLSTMLGSEKTRIPLTLGGATIGIILAALGVAGNLAPFFGLIGASFGPVIGAMIADYLLSGGRWAGPRAGVSIPGYAAWALGFLVGILNHPWIGVLPGWQIASVYSLIVGFVVYLVLAKLGLEPQVVQVPNLSLAAAPAGGDESAAEGVQGEGQSD